MNPDEINSRFSGKAKIYCSKDDTRQDGPWTYGDDSGIPESQGQRNDLLIIKRKIDEGSTLGDIMDDPALHNAWARNNRAITIYKRHKSTKRRWPMEIITLIGDTGLGKTRWAFDTYPNIYKTPSAKGSGLYFDGYDDHDQILVDEMYGNRFSHGQLLDFCDRYPLTLAVHGGFVNFNANVIVFTSNAHPANWYTEDKFPWQGGPLQRRMTTNGSRIYRVTDEGFELEEGEEPIQEGPQPE